VQNPFSHPRSTRRVPALAGAGLALSLVLPGVAAAQDPAPGDITAIPVEAAGSCGTVTVSSTGVDGSETVEVIDGGTCEPIILGQAQALPGGVDGSVFRVDGPFGPADPFLAGGPVMVSGGSVMIAGEPGLPGVVTVAAEPARTVEVTAVDGTNVTLQTDDGWTRTVDTTNVAITLDADTLAASDLAVGDRVQVIQVRNANDTYTITGLALVLPEAMGTVSEVTDTGFTVTEPDGTQTVVVVTESTRWPAMGMGGMPGADGAPASGLEGLKDGDLVHVRGTLGEDGTMTSTEILAMGTTFVVGDPAMPVPAPVEPMPQEPAPQEEPAPTPEASPAA
jgi:hypothetical protein